MIKHILSINNVSNVKLYKECFFTIFNEIFKFYDENLIEKFNLTIDNKFSSTTCVIEDILFVEYFNKENGLENTYLTLLNNLDQIICKEFHNYLIRSTYNYMAIALKYDTDFNEITSLLNLKNCEIVWQKYLKYLPYFIDENILLSANDNIITRFNMSGDELWVFDTSILGNWVDYNKTISSTKVKRVLGELKDRLYIYLNSGKILVICILSGKSINIYENNLNKDQGSFSGMFMNAIEIDHNIGKLIQLFNQRYTEVDLDTGLQTEVCLNSMKENNLENMDKFIFNDNFIIFSDRFNQKLASLNRETLMIDWIYETKDDTGIPRYVRDLKLKADKLFALDNKNTLHIFNISK